MSMIKKQVLVILYITLAGVSGTAILTTTSEEMGCIGKPTVLKCEVQGHFLRWLIPSTSLTILGDNFVTLSDNPNGDGPHPPIVTNTIEIEIFQSNTIQDIDQPANSHIESQLSFTLTESGFLEIVCISPSEQKKMNMTTLDPPEIPYLLHELDMYITTGSENSTHLLQWRDTNVNDLKEYKLMVFGDNGFASVSESFDKDYKRSPYEKPMTKAERVALVAVNRCDVRSNMSNAIELKALNETTVDESTKLSNLEIGLAVALIVVIVVVFIVILIVLCVCCKKRRRSVKCRTQEKRVAPGLSDGSKQTSDVEEGTSGGIKSDGDAADKTLKIEKELKLMSSKKVKAVVKGMAEFSVKIKKTSDKIIMEIEMPKGQLEIEYK